MTFLLVNKFMLFSAQMQVCKINTRKKTIGALNNM